MHISEITIKVPELASAMNLFTTLFGATATGANTIKFSDNIPINLREEPGFTPIPVINCGSYCICFRTDNIEKSIDFLRDRPELTMHGEYVIVPSGVLEKNRWVYFTTTWGQYIELFEWTEPPYYHSLTDKRLAEPKAHGNCLVPGIIGVDHHAFTVSDYEHTKMQLAQWDITPVLEVNFPFSEVFTYYHTGVAASGFAETALYNFDSHINIEIAQYLPSVPASTDNAIQSSAVLHVTDPNSSPPNCDISLV